ncbi:MAG: hypothetical protein HC895_13225 [Leptolyngbyaceae cyanobacterium SM1_3_5]|nr:hypothetical protein [Leptolyngbyaceae cyanobacterium SM1_3_5]
MPYRESLHHWIVVRQLSNQQNAIVARFYRRSDAEGNQRFLQLHFPASKYAVMFNSTIGI